MPPKRAKFYTYGSDERCKHTREFIEEAGVLLEVRDLKEVPMDYYELNKLIGNFGLDSFLDRSSDGYTKNNLDNKSLSREEILKLVAEDNSILRRPIVCTSRLITVGCNKEKITEMLQLGQNNNIPEILPMKRSSGPRRSRGRRRDESSYSHK